MKVISVERDGKHLVVRTDPPMSHETFVLFRDFILECGLDESTYTEHEGCIVIAKAWPFEIPRNMAELEVTVCAAAESALCQARAAHFHHE